ncbi:MAG TPA: XdhC family protein, partial [Flavisolibacter sp.]
MNNQLRVWRMIAECIKNDQPVMLLYVVDSTGSSPGRQGFMMAVTPGGLMEGSIGGGMMEYKLVELAKQRLRDT